MECNKEEAIRAKEMADKKMSVGDFLGAKMFALKAQKLYPDLENISQLLTVCDVHCSAQSKVNGLHMDWYGILQVERFSYDAAIKKQYRKLALLLHPDKNKFAGAEAAFKLIGEANRVLTDHSQRLLFDTKLKHSVATAATKQPTHPSVRKKYAASNNYAHATPYAKFTSAAPHVQVTRPVPCAQFMSASPNARSMGVAPYTWFMSSDPRQQAQQTTFWTICCVCRSRFQYGRDCLNRIIRCSHCQGSFTAYDIGPMPPGFQQSQLPSQKGVANRGPSNVASQCNGTNLPDTFVAVNQCMNVAGGNMRDAARSRESRTSNGVGRKKRKKAVQESDGSFDTTGSSISEVMGNEENGVSDTSHQPRRSRRQRQDISYKENVSDDDDDFVISQSMTGGNGSPSNRKEKNEATLDGGVRKDIRSSSSTGAKDVKQKASALYEENLANKENGFWEDGGKDEGITMLDNDNSKSEDDSELNENLPENPERVQYPDPEFGDFDKDKAEHCFAVNQIWAIYDPIDGMPRFYAKVKKLFSPGFRLQITWLEPFSDDEFEQEWCDADLPVGCGKYASGSTQEIDDILMFSHQMSVCSRLRVPYLIYPRKGETWALFKSWSMKWRSDQKMHKPPYRFEYVIVLSDFSENAGIRVSYLNKVEGFVSLFHQTEQFGIIPSKDLYKFSHRVSSFKMTGEEKGVPVGSFELDPAALLFGDPCNVKMGN